jgi:hypothetical protein
VARAVEIPAVPRDDVDLGPCREDGELRLQEFRFPGVVTVEQREDVAARRAERGVASAGEATRASSRPSVRTISAVSSLDPSSTTINSKSVNVWASAERTATPM